MPIHLGHHHRADGRYRVYAFADRSGEQLGRWAEWLLENEASPIRRFTPAGADLDAVFDVKAVMQQPHREVRIEEFSRLFLPASGPLGMTDYEKIYAANPGEDIFDIREISRDGAVVVVRPDQYVAAILPLDTPEALGEFLGKTFLER